MQANVKWVEGDTFIGRSNSNHNVVFDMAHVIGYFLGVEFRSFFLFLCIQNQFPPFFNY